MELVKVDPWVKKILVDPLKKESLRLLKGGKELKSPSGTLYKVIDGIYDLRVPDEKQTSDSLIWQKGQLEYEKWTQKRIQDDKNQNYDGERSRVKIIYNEIPVLGRCLDVGGQEGRLRAFLTEKQEYVSIDPFLHSLRDIKKQKKLIKTYPFLLKPCNFLCAHAEHLPLKSNSFKTVHMRSVIDHFKDPQLALEEANRVLVNKGQLIIGSWIRNGKFGKTDPKEFLKESLRNIFSFLGIHRFDDHHVWHPTYKELCDLIIKCSFKLKKTYWPKANKNMVCFIQAEKIK